MNSGLGYKNCTSTLSIIVSQDDPSSKLSRWLTVPGKFFSWKLSRLSHYSHIRPLLQRTQVKNKFILARCTLSPALLQFRINKAHVRFQPGHFPYLYAFAGCNIQNVKLICIWLFDYFKKVHIQVLNYQYRMLTQTK